jgi:hypothetical protein
MKKPWSISTTLRNPERIRSFLVVLQSLEGECWNFETQRKYQILLIKERVYGYGSSQFYNGLTKDQVELIDDQSRIITFEKAEEIFNAKNYEDPAMRGRQSISPLKKIGLASIKNEKIYITSLWKMFLEEDFDFWEIFLRSFLKRQIPNPDSTDYKVEDGYNIKPFIGALHLINQVNQKSLKNKEIAKWISKQEFSLFVPTLVNYQDIEYYADKIMELRAQQKGRSLSEQKVIFDTYRLNFAQEFLQTDNQEEVGKLLNNLKDYGDNAIRYFHLTRFIYIRGGWFYIDLQPRREVEINSLLSFDNAAATDFETKEQYIDYIANIAEPKLPWETKEEFKKIILKLIEDIKLYEDKLQLPAKEIFDYHNFNEGELKNYISDLRNYRRILQNEESHREAQSVEQINQYIEKLVNIYSFDDRSILLEKLCSLGLNALNDALKIKPNYPVGDDNEPTFTAPANMPDIECYYENFNAICEVTMLTSRDQRYNEWQPVMRHLRDFEDINIDKKAYCLFVAPKIHRDTLNTFWTAIKYEYEWEKQKIIPLTITNFIQLLKILVQIKESKQFLEHQQIANLYDKIIIASQHCDSSVEWLNLIPSIITDWKQQFSL